ncbi:MAG TPA: hypothetical protein VF062_13820 [Candidatus Limnocylindrales bacterium]
MRRFAVVAVALTTIALPAAPARSACTWGVTALAVPAGYAYVVAHGVAPVSPFVVGRAVRADGSGSDAVVWQDGSPRVLPKPPIQGSGSNRADAVNDQGVVAGVWRGTGSYETAWRYRNGAYQTLPSLGGTQGFNLAAINSAGDIVGQAFALFAYAGLLWRAATPGQYTNLGSSTHAVGIDDSGRMVLNTRVIVNPDGSRITLQRDVFMRTFGRGRILSEDLGKDTIVEWNLSGQVVREFAGDYPHAVNTAGVLAAQPPGSVYVAVRYGSAWEQFSTAMTTTEGITDANVVVANYDHDGTTQTEQVGGVWRRAC